MTRRRKPMEENTEMEILETLEETTSEEEVVELQLQEPEPEPTIEKSLPQNVIFLGEEDKRLLKKFNSHIVKKLGLQRTRSVKV